MDHEELIRRLAEPALLPGQFIVDIIVTTKHGPGKVLVTVDGDEGITIDDCAEISRKLSKALDESSTLGENYLLEVSTPGVDQPLKLHRQYKRNIGRKLKIKLSDKILEGKLTEVNESSVVISEEIGQGKKKESKLIEIPFAEVDKAFVLISFK